MSRDDIIQLAREAGIVPDPTNSLYVTVEYGTINRERLIHFAALVAAAEREACAISCEVNAARWINDGGKQWYAAHECASAIRARGQS